MLSFNLEQMAKNEIAKEEAKLLNMDADHDGLSDLKEAKALAQQGVDEIKILEAKISPEEIAAALNILFPGKFTSAEIAAGELAIGKVMSAIAKAANVAKASGFTV